MKILMICTVPFMKNGISSVILNIANGIDKTCHKIDVLTINKPNKDCINDLRKASCGILHIARNKDNILNYIVLLKRIIEKNKYDVVHIHGNSGTCFLEIIACKFSKCPKIVLHAHNTSCKYMAIHKVLRPIINCFDIGRVACSNDAGRFMFENQKFIVFNNAINTDVYRYNEHKRKIIRETLGIACDEIVLGHVGLFNYQKNHEFLVKIFEKYHKKTKSKLLLIGDGERRKNVFDLVLSYNIVDDVYFIGSVNNVGDYLSAIDYLIFPSRYEGLGLALIEAQASGLTCFASENVPKEANAGGNVIFIPLDKGDQYWADKIPTNIYNDRINRSSSAIKNIKKNGYEMKNEIDKLIKLYRS